MKILNPRVRKNREGCKCRLKKHRDFPGSFLRNPRTDPGNSHSLLEFLTEGDLDLEYVQSLGPYGSLGLLRQKALEIQGVLGLESLFLDLVSQIPRPRGRGRPLLAEKCNSCEFLENVFLSGDSEGTKSIRNCYAFWAFLLYGLGSPCLISIIPRLKPRYQNGEL